MHMWHQNKYITRIHNLIVLNNKDKSRLWADLTLKRQIEYLKETFCIAYRNGYKEGFFNSKGIDSQSFDATKENVVALILGL